MRKIGGVLGVVLVLMVGLGACEKEGVEGEIVIRFSLGDGGYEARGVELGKAEAETVVVAVEGVLHMYATLEEDGVLGDGGEGTNGTLGSIGTGLRAAGSEVMEIGTIIVIAAYDENGDYVTEAEYEVTDGSGGIKPTDASGRGIIITTTGDYTFVAYSLNEKESFTYSENMGPYSADNPDHDPLWGSSLKVTVSAGMNKVPIEMRHVFSKVRIKATSEELAGKPAISNVSASLVGYQAVILDGVPTKGVAENQTFADFPSTPATTAYSVQRVVYAGNEDITTIKINSATIGGTTHMGSVARFNHKLLPGRSYTLSVRFDELVWAASNVYWDGIAQKLTFDKVITANPNNQGYQGVMFKWGSLVGISPALTSVTFSTSTPIYVPTYNAGDPASSTWTRNVSHTYTSTDLIPHLDNSYTGVDESRNGTFAADMEQNTDAMYASLRGDICQYISKTQTGLAGYRLPTSSEFGKDEMGWTNRTDGWVKGDGTFYVFTGTIKEDGTTVTIQSSAPADCGYAVNASMNLTIAAGGYLYTGTLVFPGGSGNWHTASAKGVNSWSQGFDNSGINPSNHSRSALAFAVRCVKN